MNANYSDSHGKFNITQNKENLQLNADQNLNSI